MTSICLVMQDDYLLPFDSTPVLTELARRRTFRLRKEEQFTRRKAKDSEAAEDKEALEFGDSKESTKWQGMHMALAESSAADCPSNVSASCDFVCRV